MARCWAVRQRPQQLLRAITRLTKHRRIPSCGEPAVYMGNSCSYGEGKKGGGGKRSAGSVPGIPAQHHRLPWHTLRSPSATTGTDTGAGPLRALTARQLLTPRSPPRFAPSVKHAAKHRQVQLSPGPARCCCRLLRSTRLLGHEDCSCRTPSSFCSPKLDC